MNRTKRRQPMEYVGGLKFPAQEYDLSSIPDNDRAGRDAAAMMPWVRLAALFLHENDDQLEAKVRASSDAEGMSEWMDMLEGIGAVRDAKQQDAKVLEVGFTTVGRRDRGVRNGGAIMKRTTSRRTILAGAAALPALAMPAIASVTRPRQTDSKALRLTKTPVVVEQFESPPELASREFQEFVALVNQVRALGYTDDEVRRMLFSAGDFREVGLKPRAIEAAKRRATFKLVG